MRHFLYGAFWIGIYLTLIAAPLLFLLIGQPPPGRGFFRELAVGLGFVGLSMMGLQFFLTGRFKNITAPYGIDVVYHFHRLISLIAFLFIFLHPVILVVSSPRGIEWLNLRLSPWWITAGVAALPMFAVIIVTSLYRAKLGLVYEHWRRIHSYLSVAAVASAMAHIVGVHYYIEAPIKRWLWISMGVAWVLALVFIRIVKPTLMLRRPYTVENIVKKRGNSWELTLKPHGHPGLDFKPGQFGWLTLGRSPFSITEHPLSFSSSAMNLERIEITIKELGDFTSQIGKTAPGTRAYIDGPYGTFTIDRHEAHGYVFIAGGIGVTPILSMLKTMADRRDRRPLLVFYLTRTWEETIFREELEDLKNRLDLRIVYIPEEAPGGWDGESGLITAEMMARHLPEDRVEREYFVCGPRPMQTAVKIALDRLGIPLGKVQSESFHFV